MKAKNTMKAKFMFGFLVAILTLFVVATATVSAFAEFQNIQINDARWDRNSGNAMFAVEAGEDLDIEVLFEATDNEDDVRVFARILGEGVSDETAEFDVVSGGLYHKSLQLSAPSDLDDNLDDIYTLEVTVESRDSIPVREQVLLQIQRVNDDLVVLAIETEDQVEAGSTLEVEVVVTNLGRDFADDVFVRATIPSVASRGTFLGDLSSFDVGEDHEGGSEEEDSGVARLFLSIPSNTPAGVYDLEVEVFNGETTTIATRKVVIVGSGSDSQVISSGTSKNLAVNEEGIFTMTIVNRGDTLELFNLVVEAPSGLTVTLDEPVVVVPAGSSKTVQVRAMSSEEGVYNFAVNVHSNGELVQKQTFTANVEGRSTFGGGSAAVVLTIILAVIFVVLLIVLIVLLTRRPERKEEFGESYY